MPHNAGHKKEQIGKSALFHKVSGFESTAASHRLEYIQLV
jgi:hypothetical protein